MSLRGVCKKDEIIFMLIAPIHPGKPETMSNEPKRSEDSPPNPRQNSGQITPFESIRNRLLAIIKQEGKA
jgi:hypothetical protein